MTDDRITVCFNFVYKPSHNQRIALLVKNMSGISPEYIRIMSLGNYFLAPLF